MKKATLILSLLMIVSVLGGCAPAASPAEQPAAPPATEQPTEPAPDAPEPGPVEPEPVQELVTLNFPSIWVGADSKAEVFGQMVDEFNTIHAGVFEIVIEPQTDYDLYRDSIRTQIAAGVAPDIFTLDNKADLQMFARSGRLMDLTEFLGGINDRFVVGQIESAKVDGVNFGMPFEMAIVPIMINQSLFEAAGAAIPTSFEEIWEAGPALRDIGIAPMGHMTSANAWFSMLWYSYMLAAVGGPDVYANGLNNPAFERAAELMVTAFEHTTTDAVGADATVVNGHFFNERIALYTNGTWILGRIRGEGVDGLMDNLVMSPGLSFEGRNGGSFITAVQAYIAAGAQDDPNKQAAVQAFFEHITDAGRLTELSNSSGAMFAVNLDPAAFEDPVLQEIIVLLAEASFTIPHFQAELPTPVVNEFPAALEALVLGLITPAEFVQQLIDADF